MVIFWDPWRQPKGSFVKYSLTSRLGKALSCLFPKAPPYMVKSSILIYETHRKRNMTQTRSKSRSVQGPHVSTNVCPNRLHLPFFTLQISCFCVKLLHESVKIYANFRPAMRTSVPPDKSF